VKDNTLKPIYSAVGAILKEQRAEIDALLEAQQANLDTQQQALAALKSSCETDIQQINDSTAESLSQVDQSLVAKLNALAEEVSAAQAGLEKRLGEHDKYADRFGELESAVNESLAGLTVKCEQKAEKLTGSFKEKTDAIELNVTNLGTYFSELAEKIVELSNALADFKKDTKLSDTLGEHFKLISDLAVEIGQLQQVDHVTPKQLDDLGEQVSTKVDVKTVDAFGEVLNGQAKRISDIVDDVENLQGVDYVTPEQLGDLGEQVNTKADGETVDALGEHVVSLARDVESLQNVDHVTPKQLDDLGAQVNTKANVEDLKTAQVEFKSSIDDLVSRFGQTTEEFKATWDNLTKVDEKTKADIEDIYKALKSIPDHTKSISNLAEAIDLVKDGVDGHSLVIQGIQETLSGLPDHTDDIAAVNEVAKSFGDDLAKQTEEIADIRDTIAGLPALVKGEVDETYAEIVDQLAQDLDEHTETLIKLQEHLSDEVDLSHLEKGLASAEASLGTLSTKLGDVATLDHFEKITDIAKQLDKRISTVEARTPEKGEKGDSGIGVELEPHVPNKVYRSGSFVQRPGGKIYRAVVDTAKNPYQCEDWVRVGSLGFEFCGVKDPDKQYEDGDIYIDDGSTFLWMGGKAKMIAQRGKPGKPGKPGKAGKAAPDLIGGYFDSQVMHLLKDDDTSIEVEVKGFEDFIAQVVKNLGEGSDLEETQFGTAVKTFRGLYLPSKSYRVGDLVTHIKSLWLCHTAARVNADFNDRYWVKLAGSTGGGGGGGGGTNTGLPISLVNNLQLLAVDRAGGTPFWKDGTGLIQIVKTKAARDLLTSPGRNVGTVAYETDLDTYYYWDGTTWKALGGGAPIVSPNYRDTTPFGPGNLPPKGKLRIIREYSTLGDEINRLVWWDDTKGQWVPVDPHVYLRDKPSGNDPKYQDHGVEERDLLASIVPFHRELKIWHTGTWHTLFSEDEINGLIAAARSFQGTITEKGANQIGSIELDTLKPETGANNLQPSDVGSYWVWTGADGYTITPNDIGGQASNIDNGSLTPGDWIQVANKPLTLQQQQANVKPGSNGQQYVIIHGDILSKARADKLYGLQPWVAGAREVGTLVAYKGDIYRARTGIGAADPAPDTGGLNNHWDKVDIQGNLKSVPNRGSLPNPANSTPGDIRLVLTDPNAGNGSVIYAFDRGQWSPLAGALSTLVDVDTTGVQNGSIIAFDAQANKWKVKVSSDRGLKVWVQGDAYQSGQIVYHKEQFWQAVSANVNQEPKPGKLPPYGTVLVEGSIFDEKGTKKDFNWNLPDATWIHRFIKSPANGFVTTPPSAFEVIQDVAITNYNAPNLAIIQDEGTNLVHVYVSDSTGTFHELPKNRIRFFYRSHYPSTGLLPVGTPTANTVDGFINIWIYDITTLHAAHIVESGKNDPTKTVTLPYWISLDLSNQPEHVGGTGGGGQVGLIGGTQQNPLLVMTQSDYDALHPKRGTIVVIG
jgi:phage shock protein A